jgi:4-aminobutyrate aminotransferase-like enzyme
MVRNFSVAQERKLVTELPGPNSLALQARREAAVSKGAGTLANIYMERGSGAILVDVDGNQLIDLGCGIGVTTIGHAHPAVAAAAAEQAEKLTHTLFTVTPYENYVKVSERLQQITPGDFDKHSILVNTGAEAVENAVKIARKYTGRRAIVALDHAFQPIQGDGGIVIPAPGYFARIAEFCAENGIVFVADEIQAGIARTGTWYSIEHHGVVPDLVTSAKGLAGGFPLAAVTGRDEIMDAVQPGGIGGTFGGNPVSTAAALAVLDAIESEGLLAEAQRVERALQARIGDWAERFDIVGEVRGKGAMFGVELVHPGTRNPNPEALTSVIRYAAEHGVIVLDAGSWDSVLRFLPSVVISEELIDDAASVIEEAFAAL